MKKWVIEEMESFFYKTHDERKRMALEDVVVRKYS
jgi:hypothetical protein